MGCINQKIWAVYYCFPTFCRMIPVFLYVLQLITVPEKIRWITQESGPQISTAPDGTELIEWETSPMPMGFTMIYIWHHMVAKFLSWIAMVILACHIHTYDMCIDISLGNTIHSMYPSTCLSVLSLFIHLSILSILVGQPWQMLPRSSKHALDVCQGHQRFEVPNYILW